MSEIFCDRCARSLVGEKPFLERIVDRDDIRFRPYCEWCVDASGGDLEEEGLQTITLIISCDICGGQYCGAPEEKYEVTVYKATKEASVKKVSKDEF